jgi:hypothetical protein
MIRKRLRRPAFLIGIASGSSLLAQSSSISYPSARRADVIDDYFGSTVADPYRWMEDLNSPELKRWIDARMPSPSAFAATLQVAQGCDKPVLIRIETQASHAYRPTDKGIAELADGWAFALANMRVRPPDTAAR